jgi:DNA repair exonuclease SbcCD ATPase subunit
MKEWLIWLGRGAEKERAYNRLETVKQQYGAYGERVIRLSQRTDTARRTAGSTQQAFEFVERAFIRATQEYARIGELIGQIEAGLSRGRVGDFQAVESALQGLEPLFAELDGNLTTWEQTWRTTPAKIEEAARSLAELREQVERAAALIGAPLPLTEQVSRLEQYLEKIRQTMAEGNPIEASHQVDDLKVAAKRVVEQVGTYASCAGAIAQAEQEVAEVKERLAASKEPPADAVGAVAAAEALLPRLRPALAAGRLDPFQEDLLQLQRHLSRARAALK